MCEFQDLDLVFEFLALEQPVYVQAWEMDLLWGNLADFDYFFGFDDDSVCRFCSMLSIAQLKTREANILAMMALKLSLIPLNT